MTTPVRNYPPTSYPGAAVTGGVQSAVPAVQNGGGGGGGGYPGPPGGGGPPGAPLPQGGGAVGPGAPVPESYFTESRKGEVNELRTLLRNFSVERDAKKKREVIKKVIAYMTLGIDVSRLFTEMMLAIETRDLVVKKMVYLFLCNYATANPDLAQMCTNTLQKDCGNDDPMVRGLALRALCSLRLPQMVEYISEPCRRALTDTHAYVRKTAVMGMLKLYHLDRDAFESCGAVDALYDMLRDPDAQVVSNCIRVLDEVMQHGPNGGMAINRAVMLHLLNRIHEFTEFGVLAVLGLVPRYIPANDEEGYQIMNLLDPVLRTNNAGTFMAAVKAFLSIADSVGDDPAAMKAQVVRRIKAPLITLSAGASPEMTYALLRHVDSLIELCPGAFNDEYRQFYVRYNEPTHIKYLKAFVLPKLADPSNAPDIVAELGEYVADADARLGRSAVRSMARIACRDSGGEGSVQSITRRLVEMLDLDVPHVTSEAARALADVVRVHPEMRALVAPPLPRAVKYVTEPAGRAAVIQLLGECGESVPLAPYCLERLIDSYDDITDSRVKTALLTATVRLFFRRPPEVRAMLGRLLSRATEDVSDQDLHDRALLYYRLLRSSDPRALEGVVSSDSAVSGLFEEEDDSDAREELMAEFDSLSVIYGSASENFVEEEYRVRPVRQPKEHPLESAAPPVADLGVSEAADRTLGVTSPDGGAGAEGAAAVPPASATESAPAPAPAPAAASSDVADLLGFDDGPTPITSSAPARATAPSHPGLRLSPTASLTGDEYQSAWASVPDSDAVNASVPLRSVPTSTDAVEGPLSEFYVSTMASGELSDEFKFFLYAKEEEGDGGVTFLIQAVISKGAEPRLGFTVKCSGGGGGPGGGEDREKVDGLVGVMRSALSSYI